MTQILSVTRKGDLHFDITDQFGKTVNGPFDTNAAAWKALDRLDSASSNQPPAHPKSNKKVLWGKPQKKSKKARRKERKQKAIDLAKLDQKMKVNAEKAPGWIRRGMIGKFDPAGELSYRDHKLGTFGAASEVKQIDPAVYLAEKAARGSDNL
ncbi:MULTISPECIES: hypothetical protein [unclassified Rhizobium]|uniref:hypothetical protein n=1 Tax=unclassified Rhizobium TaxID=2613769 RepID=UPI0007124B6D|nr:MULTISPECIES: hypothetical protein [unclassified Rhizobium]KQT03194.1 hypothetical protein ASG42_24600 [Rhizobium sp. Leaf391]KQU08411.1 hypothetical protein ASG68_22760 [Rhizobium sp. Leaf453]